MSTWSTKTVENFINYDLPISSEENFYKGKVLAERFNCVDISAADSIVFSNSLSDTMSIDSINSELFRGIMAGHSKVYLHRMDQKQNKFTSYEIFKQDGKLHYERLTK
jgi:hypothetical protein